ncbi:NlpC/P60 family protein [Flavobacterium amniphilum]|uniref:peptidoglycan endopeptidase n=1 Tax=Flavobacterium amniphilum TaxID=1834035 RepID=UPI00202AAB03|nr:peptidoglycan endopeptidase [Flavobacterium amniphilum]MCL9806119.1 NlpC/P60 family protein [Flavobacterium amniphilum]
MLRYCCLLFLFLFTFKGFSQEKIKHIVAGGESVYSIAKKYDVKLNDIYQLNPKAKGSVLALKSVLWIPVKQTSRAEKELVKNEKLDKTVNHEVLPKETLYGISKKYKVSIETIKENNPAIEKEGLAIGMKLQIPVSEEVYGQNSIAELPKKVELENVSTSVRNEVGTKDAVENVATSEENITHTVQLKETKYGISKRYGISIADLEEKNPHARGGLHVGDVLVIKGEIKKEKEKDKENTEVVANQPENQEIQNNQDVATTENAPVAMLPLSADASMKADFLIAKASENLGSRYRSGGTTPAGFDCSGLMFATFKNIEMTLPRSSRDMAQNAGTRIERSQAQKGDLIFFATMGGGRVSHVGMVTEVLEDEIKFIHSSTSAGVIISSTKEAYYARRFVQVNRVLE